MGVFFHGIGMPTEFESSMNRQMRTEHIECKIFKSDPTEICDLTFSLIDTKL